ncbi:hypothetical protein [Halomonas sp. LBP4]|uniref:hypothetical protein n=1 Tax=Halomonas sp. LBP4 TaxID=2044917 RepID=UPI000D75F322|nr:hypothetical protein [Halomonas sp. LBP4]PXX95623.1 hypothetical protein CR157_18380 [Halomonas sp. LBP4]
MAYFLVMGGLALSVFFTFGWLLLRTGQWLARGLPGGGGASRRARRPARRTPAKKPARAPAAKSRPRAATRRAEPREPWRLTRWLARRRFALPMSLLAVLLYGLTRLAEYGMGFRPHEVPGAYHSLVGTLGWIAAVLLAVALVNLLAAWRCRGR